MTLSLESLPVELVYQLQLYALSESLPLVNRRTFDIFKVAIVSYRVEYIMGRFFEHKPQRLDVSPPKNEKSLISYALRFRLCTKEVVESLLARAFESSLLQSYIEKRPCIPRRFFSSLAPRSKAMRPWSSSDEPLPFLRYLCSNPHFDKPNANIYEGYPLSRAVHASHTPLIEFLLAMGASPEEKDALAVRIAIRKRDLCLVQLLIERIEDPDVIFKKGCAKRRRLSDRMEVTTALLKMAVEVDARDIVEYFMDKGARPDMKTLQLMVKRGIV